MTAGVHHPFRKIVASRGEQQLKSGPAFRCHPRAACLPQAGRGSTTAAVWIPAGACPDASGRE